KIRAFNALRVEQDREGPDDPDVLAQNAFELLLMDKSTVLDGAHAFLDAKVESGPAMRMRSNISIRPRRLFDGGGDLLARVGAGMQRLARAARTTRCKQLDEVGALRQILPRQLPDLGGAVRRPQTDAVAMRCRERDARRDNARPRNEAVRDCLLEIDVDIVFFAHDARGGDAGAHVLE